MTTDDTLLCPLCQARSPACYHADGSKRYFRCAACTLIFLHPSHRPSRDEETARYRQHRNDAADPDYLRFLCRLADPVAERLSPGARGLDFGCGPAPALSALLTARGFPCVAYDPLFAPHDSMLTEQYDFVTCSEVIEHVHAPHEVWPLFARLLARGGLLGVMTRLYGTERPFAEWWYRRDPTHVCFYAESTMQWIADHHAWAVAFPRPHVALFTLPTSTG
jgi:SAM-dependent methyltransferase